MAVLENFYVIGVNHQKHDLEKREVFAKLKPKLIFEKLHNKGVIKGFVNLTTCLRVDFFFVLNDNFGIESILEKLEIYKDELYSIKGWDSIKYLFEVTCGLKSVILGEEPILSQVKKSFLLCLQENKTCLELNIIFNRAISLGKNFRTLSKINKKALSLENIALKFIEKHFNDLINKRILIIGVGEVSNSILFLLKKKGVKNITITNRTYHKIINIQKKYNVNTIDFHKKYKAIKNSDIIISATSAPHYVIRKKTLRKYVNDNRSRFFLDLAVPRDVEEDIIELENIVLYNLDDLWDVHRKNLDFRLNIAEKYRYLVDDQFKYCIDWFENRKKRMCLDIA